MSGDYFDSSVLQWNYQGLRNIEFSKRLDSQKEQDLKKIKSLFLKRNLLSVLPKELGKLISLTNLHVQANNLKSLSDSLGQLKCLEVLNVEGNCLTELPPSIGKLSQLKKLQVSNNSLRTLPTEIGQLVNLTTLEASNNSLCYIPQELGHCRCLRTISLDRNILTWLPRQLCNLQFLEELSVCGNFLEYIPQNIGDLKSLNALNLDNNPQLTYLPQSADRFKVGFHSCGLAPTEKTTPGHMIYVQQHNDVKPTGVVLPFEIEKVLEPDKCCVPSLEELALRMVGSMLQHWPDLIKNGVLPKKLDDLLQDCTAKCFTCENNIYTSAFPDIQEEYVDPKRFMGLYLGFCCSKKCMDNIPLHLPYSIPTRPIPGFVQVYKRHKVFVRGPT